jgi:hypothetical protein
MDSQTNFKSQQNGEIKSNSPIDATLNFLTRNDNQKQTNELKQYDRLEFVDVNKEIKTVCQEPPHK